MSRVSCGYEGDDLEVARNLLAQYGPTLRVDLGFDDAYRPSRPDRLAKLPAEGIPALIDTGASTSCIDATLAMQLQLPVVDQQPCAGIGGLMEVNMHLAQIHARVCASLCTARLQV